MSERVPIKETKKAEEMLTSEQKVLSDTRYEVIKHKSSFLRAGVNKEQVQNASIFASEKALKKYKKLEAQYPRKNANADALAKYWERYFEEDKPFG